MFNFFRKKSDALDKAWEDKKPETLGAREKLLYSLANGLRKTRIMPPEKATIPSDAQNRIKENFYLKYFNLIGSRQTAQNLLEKEDSRLAEPKEKETMTIQPKMKMALLYAGVAVIVLALALGYYFTRGPAEDNGNLALAAHLSVADGSVETWDGSGWKAVVSGETLGSQSQLRTGKDAKAVLEFDEGSALRLDENTHVILEEINNQKITVLQVAGETYSRVNKTSNLTYNVKTGNTETVAVGTAFGVATEASNWVKKGEKKVIVKVVESKVKVKIIKNEEALEKEVSEGEELIVDMAKPIEDSAKKIPLPKEETVQDGFFAWNRDEDNKESYPLGILSDMTPPEIKISEPLDGIKTELYKVAVKGTTESDAKIWVGGMETKNAEGNFEKIITLKTGENKITVKTKDDSGNTAEKTITVIKEGPTVQVSPLYLKGWTGTDGIHLSWTLSGITAPKGFKLVKSLDAYPAYPGDSAVYLNPETRSYLWQINDGKTWHFRVCIYEGGSCGAYSNDIRVTSKSSKETGNSDVYGTLALTGWVKTERIIYLSWALSGNAPYGYKLVKSTIANPSYPGNEAIYISSTDLKGGYAWDVKNPGTYHFRVCAYNGGGGCVFYSNDYSITVQ